MKLLSAVMLGLLVMFSSFSVVDTPIDHDNIMVDIHTKDQISGPVESYSLCALAAVSLAGFFWLLGVLLRVRNFSS